MYIYIYILFLNVGLHSSVPILKQRGFGIPLHHRKVVGAKQRLGPPPSHVVRVSFLICDGNGSFKRKSPTNRIGATWKSGWFWYHSVCLSLCQNFASSLADAGAVKDAQIHYNDSKAVHGPSEVMRIHFIKSQVYDIIWGLHKRTSTMMHFKFRQSVSRLTGQANHQISWLEAVKGSHNFMGK